VEHGWMSSIGPSNISSLHQIKIVGISCVSLSVVLNSPLWFYSIFYIR
jgi:hypothetical protein